MNASPSGLAASSGQSTSLTCGPICSCCAAFQVISVPITGDEFVAKAVQEWIAAVGAKTAYIEAGSPWENGYVESFNARLRGELLNGEIFYSPRAAQSSSRAGAGTITRVRPHASLRYRPPAPCCYGFPGPMHSEPLQARRANGE